ncbi:GNAT family N-acetyltransferase [Anaerocolumna sp. AGMB13025]|uniref:GNAT family N-acetyltransferase n=1 Tax=Anaerocolumna sp. AGMB13025 TaxID=3039116 RepID=UPI00241EFFC3|nr:GNAT family N-acetyltransferase [Anaerocolumna sp. AGMB13025]WFR56436.1 GNAT family N-acetyltransferase [Anaerocolumna sp. AGMB13025]
MEYKLYNTIDEIQSAGKSDSEAREDIYELWQECFGDTDSYTDFYFEWKVKDNRILTIYKQNQLSAMLHLNPYSVMIRGKKQTLNYIVGVATRLEDRHQGLMKQLLETALKQMYEEHMPFTYLMPAAEAIYVPFGFRIVYEQELWKQKIMAAGRNSKETDFYKDRPEQLNLITVAAADEEAIEELTDFTNRYLQEYYDIYTLRSPYYYKRLIHEMESGMGGVLLCTLGDKTMGYAAYMTDGGLGIAECLCRADAKEAFMKAVAEQILDSNVIHATEQQHSIPSIMARIVNLNEFLKDLTAREDVTLRIKAEDSIVKQNNGTYRLTFTKTGCVAEKTQEEPELAADISDLTRLFFGRLTHEEITKLICNGKKEDILQKISKLNCYSKLFINDVV